MYCKKDGKTGKLRLSIDPVVQSKLSDSYPLNGDFVWMPPDCHYPLRGEEELQQGFRERGISRLVFRGDSLAREPYHAMLPFIVKGGRNEFGQPSDDMVCKIPGDDYWTAVHPVTTKSGMHAELAGSDSLFGCAGLKQSCSR